MRAGRGEALAKGLAHAFLAGEWLEPDLLARGTLALGRRPRWLTPLVRGVLEAYHRPPLDRPRELTAYVEWLLPSFDGPPPHVHRWLPFEPAMALRRWPVPELATLGDLATFLDLTPGELGWFAEARRLERHENRGKLRHYRYTWLPRRLAPPRVVEAPKARLKAIQRRLLHELLDAIPPHDAAHGFAAATRSGRTWRRTSAAASSSVSTSRTSSRRSTAGASTGSSARRATPRAWRTG